jgi:hypothetical protein
MRVKRLIISCDLFCHLFTQGAHRGYLVTEQAIPDDATIRNVRLGWPTTLEVLLESETFETVREGDDIPLLSPQMMHIHAEVSGA